jgi:hypothetical protein
MERVQGNIQSNKMRVDFDKIGHIDGARTNVYKMPVHEKSSLRFALKGVKATRVELFAESTLLSVVVPQYGDDWTVEDITPIKFFGDKNFHRGLTDVPVEVVVTTVDTNMPSIMVGVVTPSKKWDDVEGDHYVEDVTAGSDSGEKNMRLMYHREGCGFVA